MTKRKMALREYDDLICTVKENWGYIVEATIYDIPWPSREHAKSSEVLRSAGVLDRDLKLDAKWRNAIDDVCAGRPVHELSDHDHDDMKRVVDVWYRSEFN